MSLSPQQRKKIALAFPELAPAFANEDLVEALKSVSNASKMPPELLAKLKVMEGPQGPEGKKGDTYTLTNDDVNAILERVTPQKGVHYFDGKDGLDGKNGKDGKGIDGRDGEDGKNGKDGTEIEPKDIANKLNSLKEAIDVSVIKGAVHKKDLEKQDKKLLDGMTKIDGRFKLVDQRYHGGGLSKVSHDTTLSGSGTPSDPLIVIGGGSGSGTVTSVGLTGSSTGLTFTSSTSNPITTSGVFTLGGLLAATNGGNIFNLDTNTPASNPLNGVYRIRQSFYNFLPNAGFDIWTNGISVPPTTWTAAGGVTVAQSSTSTIGPYSAQLTYDTSNTGEFYNTAGVSTLVDYTFSIYAQLISGSGSARLVAQDNASPYTEYASIPLNSGAGWQLNVLTVKPTGSAVMRFSIKSNNSIASTWLVDEAMFQEGKGVASAFDYSFIDDTSNQLVFGNKYFGYISASSLFLPTAGTPGIGKVLTSDSTGNATWQKNIPISIIDTEANILATTPSAGEFAYATDLKQLMMGNGTNWIINSSYFDVDLQNPDMGYVQGSNREGYGQTYVSDKIISNSTIGSNGNTISGGIRYNPTGNNLGPTLQTYYGGSWNNIVAGFEFREYNKVLQTFPVGGSFWISIFSGDSEEDLGMNGLPEVQGYMTSMGAYPVQQIVDGGSF